MSRHKEITKAEQNAIRIKLRLRQRPTGEYEVYTTAYGTGLFKWFIISKETHEWYLKTFPEIVTIIFNQQEN